MAQKKVSVRLVAEGGRPVKAEFAGIGDAGENSFKRIERQADVTGAVLRRLAGIVAGALSIRQIVAYADQRTDLRSRVDLTTGSQEAGAAVMDRLAAMARRTYSSLGQTICLGTGGAFGSNTVVNIGSATAGANGMTVTNTPTVTFANAVTQVGMPQANLTAQLLGLGGATADGYNRLSVNTPAVLLNNAGAGIEATVNKAAAGNDAAFAFKTNWSARALIGLLGSDDFSFKVSPDGSSFFDAIRIDRASGQVELPQPTILPGLNAAPTPPSAGKAAVYARNRAGAPWIDVMRPSGRDFPLQPHFGVNRIANWSPSTGTTINSEGLPITSVGTVSHPTLAATNLGTSMRRWRITLPLSRIRWPTSARQAGPAGAATRRASAAGPS